MDRKTRERAGKTKTNFGYAREKLLHRREVAQAEQAPFGESFFPFERLSFKQNRRRRRMRLAGLL